MGNIYNRFLAQRERKRNPDYILKHRGMYLVILIHYAVWRIKIILEEILKSFWLVEKLDLLATLSL